MVTDPVREHDDYTMKRENQRNASLQIQGGEKNFRFSNYRTEKDRIVVFWRSFNRLLGKFEEEQVLRECA